MPKGIVHTEFLGLSLKEAENRVRPHVKLLEELFQFVSSVTVLNVTMAFPCSIYFELPWWLQAAASFK